jgi:phage anti-repressor protein
LICRLLKSLYGLKQSPRQWNKHFDEFMKALGFVQSIYNSCVYIKRVSNSIFGYIILVLYIDDMFILAKNQYDVDKLKNQLNDEFWMKN